MKLKYITCLCAIVASLLFFSEFAYCQPKDVTEQATVYKSMSPATAEAILKGMGIEYQRIETHSGYYAWRFYLGGFRAALILNRSGSILQMVSGFPMKTPPAMKKINDWNRKMAIGTAFFTAKGYPAISASVLLSGGVTRNAVKEFIRKFRVLDSGYALWLQMPDGR